MAEAEPRRTGDLRRRRPPARTLAWACESVGRGSRVISVRRLTTGCWHSNHALSIAERSGATHRLVLRRWARPGWDLEDPDFNANRELAVLAMVANSSLPVPRVVAADPRASACDVPTLLLTRLPGKPPGLPPELEPFLAQLAEALCAIHSLDGAGIPRYRRGLDPAALLAPAWSGRPELWERAIEIARSPAPAGRETFIHGDYHPENTLWSRGRLTGIVDWTSGSLGPAAVDVGHMRWNLAVDYGLDAAEEFVRLYRSLDAWAKDDQRYWDIVTLLDVVGDVEPGEELGPFDVARFERYLETLL